MCRPNARVRRVRRTLAVHRQSQTDPEQAGRALEKQSFADSLNGRSGLPIAASVRRTSVSSPAVRVKRRLIFRDSRLAQAGVNLVLGLLLERWIVGDLNCPDAGNRHARLPLKQLRL